MNIVLNIKQKKKKIKIHTDEGCEEYSTIGCIYIPEIEKTTELI